MIAIDALRNDSPPGEGTRPIGKTRDTSSPQYQELKFSIHRKLLDRINLEAVYAMPGDRVRQEIRPSIAKLVNEEKTPLSLVEKDGLIEEVLDEVFGLGPLEPLLRDKTISDILVTTPRLIYIERAGKARANHNPIQG
jgi:pilus assembly protein CpaF